MSYQSPMPMMNLGSYSFRFGPNRITYDQETDVATHPIVGAHEQVEPVGFTSQKLGIEGFLFSTDDTSLLDMFLWVSQEGYYSRPVALNLFDQDFSATNTSQPWYSGVGYLTNVHFEYRGGYANYKYPFRFNFIEARPAVYIATQTQITQANVTYGFDLTNQGNGFIAGVRLTGGAIATVNSVQQYIVQVADNNSNPIGQGPPLGVPGNRLFAGNPLILSSGIGSIYGQPYVIWPVVDLLPAQQGTANQSIKRTSPTGLYSVQFAINWDFQHLPTNIEIVYVPL